MTMQDPISDLLTRVHNAQMARHVDVQMPHSVQSARFATSWSVKASSRVIPFQMN